MNETARASYYCNAYGSGANRRSLAQNRAKSLTCRAGACAHRTPRLGQPKSDIFGGINIAMVGAAARPLHSLRNDDFHTM